MMRPTRAHTPNRYLLGTYRIATAPEPNSSRLTSLKSTRFDSPASNVGPWNIEAVALRKRIANVYIRLSQHATAR